MLIDEGFFLNSVLYFSATLGDDDDGLMLGIVIPDV